MSRPLSHADLPSADIWLGVARSVADEFAATAREREQNRQSASAEIARLKESGLLALSIPAEYGGAGLGWDNLARIVREIARGDASLALLLGVHYIATTAVWRNGIHGSGADFLAAVVRERWFVGVVFNPLDPSLTVDIRPDSVILSGSKSFCTGAPLADRILIMAQRQDTKAVIYLVIPQGLPGVTQTSDWDAIGMRLGDSSSFMFDNAAVGLDSVVSPLHGAYRQTPWNALFGLMVWLLYTNYYLGAAWGAFAFARGYTLTKTRPWITANVDRASQDPYIIELYGQVYIELKGAEALLDRAASDIEAAIARGPELTAEERGEAAVSLFTARVATSRAALDATSRLFEAMGARAATDRVGFDRYWRDVRTHTLHHPLAYKVREVGDYALNANYPDYSSGYS
jgi:alkylation response protein AidB-like acyl-CoA dehydrogenase